MCNCNGKNQTTKEIIENIRERLRAGPEQHLSDIRGTGLFMVPDPESGILEYKTVYVADISYDECIKRGEHCLAFKWLPEAMVTRKQVEDFFKKSKKDRILDCDGFCNFAGGGCPGLCFCGPGNYCS